MNNKINEKILAENWTDIKKKVIDPLWDYKFKSMYLSVKLDKNDFESLAHEELTKAFEYYNPDDAAVITYAFNIVSKKPFTELRNCTKRDRRKALYVSTSLNAPVGDGSDVEFGETIEVKQQDDGDSFLTEKRVGKFVNTLSNLQLRVMILILLNFDKSEISSMLEVPKNRIKDTFKELMSTDTKNILNGRAI